MGIGMTELATGITASILVIGDEILSGRTQDENVQFIAKSLGSVGIVLSEVRIVPDNLPAIITAIHELSKSYDYVFTTGGIGPTHDDITSEAMAAAFNRPIALNSGALKAMSEYAAKLGKTMNEASKKMAYIPEDAKLLHNSISGAPGFLIENVYVLPGVPYIMRAMFELLIPTLKHGPAIKSYTIRLKVGESIVADILRSAQEKYKEVSIGSYPFVENDRHCTNVVVTSSNHAILEEAYEELEGLLLQFG